MICHHLLNFFRIEQECHPLSIFTIFVPLFTFHLIRNVNKINYSILICNVLIFKILHIHHLSLKYSSLLIMQPLAERMRPRSLDEYIGQKHLVGENAVLRRTVESDRVPSMILWGPPGVGKTTLANIIASVTKRAFFSLSAVNSGVKDVRETIEEAKRRQFFNTANPILFIDEIHRFSKSQQDSLLGAVEKGIVTLIGATTENPSFEVIPALLSRCQVYVLKELESDDLLELVHRALKTDEVLQIKNIVFKETDALLLLSGGCEEIVEHR